MKSGNTIKDKDSSNVHKNSSLLMLISYKKCPAPCTHYVLLGTIPNILLGN